MLSTEYRGAKRKESEPFRRAIGPNSGPRFFNPSTVLNYLIVEESDQNQADAPDSN